MRGTVECLVDWGQTRTGLIPFYEVNVADTCAIWGTPAVRIAVPESNNHFFYSHRTGGSYGLTSSSIITVKSLSIEDKSKLTTWIVDQRRTGTDRPLIKTANIEEIRPRRVLSYSERADRFFVMCSTIGVRPGVNLRISGIVDDNLHRITGLMAAWTEAQSESEVNGLLRVLASQGYGTFTGSDFAVSGSGFQRMEELSTIDNGSFQAFVAMWFGDEMSQPYDHGIKPAVEKAGYRSLRIDAKEHNNKIDDEIILEIRRSRFVVADFTSPILEHDGEKISQPRGGVYFEAGYAKGLGIPVIWTVRKDMLSHVHFDTRQFSHIVWGTPNELEDALFKRIGATIGLRSLGSI